MTTNTENALLHLRQIKNNAINLADPDEAIAEAEFQFKDAVANDIAALMSKMAPINDDVPQAPVV